MIRATTTHFDKYGIEHRIDVIKSGYVGTATELRGNNGFLQFQHENLSEADVFSTPIQRGRLDFGVWINGASEKAVIDEMLLAQEGDFTIEWYRNGSLFWTGTVMLDLSQFTEKAFPYEAKITAKDLTVLEGLIFPTYADPTFGNLLATRRTLISIIAECLPYGLNIVSATSWIESHVNTTEDFLRNVYIDAVTFQGQTMFEVLQNIMSANALFLKQTDGVWLIEQLSAHTVPSTVTRWTYDSTGAYIGQSVVNPIITANSNLKIVTGSISSVAPAYKQVGIQYDGDFTGQIEVPETLVVQALQTPSYVQRYQSVYNPPSVTTEERVRFTTSATITNFQPNADTAQKQFYDLFVTIQASDWNMWNAFDPDNPGAFSRRAKWSRSELVKVLFRARYSGYDASTSRATYKASITIESEPIPKYFLAPSNFGFLRLTFFPSGGGSITYENTRLELIQGPAGLLNQYTQTNQYSTAYENTVSLGDGPRIYVRSALRYRDFSFSNAELYELVTSEWQRRGSTAWRSHSQNLAKEIMDFQRAYVRTLQAVAREQFSPSQTLNYDSVSWYYIGGSFDGYTGDWTMTFVRNAFVTASDAFTTVEVFQPTQLDSGLVTAIANQPDNQIDASGQFLMRLALPATGSISQIFVNDIGQFNRLKAGQVLRLVHPITLQSEEVTVRLDRTSGTTVNVEPVTLSAEYPIGSYVFVSAQSIQAGILVADNAVRIFAEGQAMGRLTANVSDYVTEIPVNLYTKVLRGMDMQVVNKLTGEFYAIVVDQDDAGPGEVLLAIEEQFVDARTGDNVVGDNSFQQSQITVTQGLIVLKVNSNGKVAQIKLGADNLGSEITISAEQVNINGIVFTEGTVSPAVPGNIRTSNYIAGSTGWKIDGDGSAELNNVTVRGVLQVASIDGDLTLNTGVIRNASGNLRITPQGVEMNPGTTLNPTGGASVYFQTLNQIGFLTAFSNLADTELNVVLRGGYILTLGTKNYTGALVITESAGGRVDIGLRALFSQQIEANNTTDSTSKDTGSIVTEGGIGVEKSAYIGANLRVLGTTDSTSKDTGAVVVEGGVGIEKNATVGGLLVAPRVGYTYINESDSPYTLDANTEIVFVDTTVSSVDFYLGTQAQGRRVTICDQTGNFSVNACGLYSSGSDSIRGVTGFYDSLIDSYMSITLVYHNGVWTIISRTN